MAIVMTCGEPAGIGPALCLRAAEHDWPQALVAVGSAQVLAASARTLGIQVQIHHSDGDAPSAHRAGHLPVIDVPTAAPVTPGTLDPANGHHVLDTLRVAIDACLAGRYGAMVTAPVHKGVINDAGVPFTGHTEFLAARAGVPRTVMLLAADTLRVALATTHLPLRDVADAISVDGLHAVLRILHADLRDRFGLSAPRIMVCGLNPHAGEDGHLGREEIDIIAPALATLRAEGMDLVGPLPADTAFLPGKLAGVDAVLAMYHDQGLPVLKHAGFSRAVNITLGLPFVRTSVDHGTALDIAATGGADPGSMLHAVELALALAPA